MPRTASIFARVNPELKRQAELVLKEQDTTLQEAIEALLQQIVLQQRLPIDTRLPIHAPVSYTSMTMERFNDELERGLANYYTGRVQDVHEVFEELEREQK
ncbi:MAG: type II toxin-antitoxin system RelB/DinJ family antitoxin [Clostridia bacterium]|nr:type II toxin-antitoxin system RelB/DinJ family antitoxin [Clostridia bacterium]